MINFYPLTKGYFLRLIKLLVFIYLSSFLFTSCAVSKPTYIFRDIVKDTIIKGFVDTDIELKIQKNDILSISISSLNPIEDQLFNAAMGTVAASTAKAEGGAGGYLVNLDGNIYLHKLGTIPVAGLTRKQLKLQLETDLIPFLKDPIVTISFSNHFITVINGLGSSQIINMPAEKIALINAIAQSGSIGADATVKNLMVIRETPDSKIFKHLNLENQSIFTSPWYYLQPKDIVVIKPNEEKLFKEQKRARNQLLLSTILTGLSIFIIILDRIIRR